MPAPEPVDLNALYSGAQAQSQMRLSGGLDFNVLGLQTVATVRMGETSVLDAVAAKEAGKTGISTDLAGFNAANKIPNA